MLNQCSTLSHHSLESFIIEQSQTDSSYQLPELVKHPKITTISDKVNQIWKILCLQTYKSAKEKNQLSLLNEKQLSQLRKLTIFNLLQERPEIQLSTLSKEIDVNKIALYKILTEMNTKDLVSIKINEKTGVVHILASKRRNQPVPNKKLLADECEQRLIRILQDNVQLIQNLNKFHT